MKQEIFPQSMNQKKISAKVENVKLRIIFKYVLMVIHFHLLFVLISLWHPVICRELVIKPLLIVLKLDGMN